LLECLESINHGDDEIEKHAGVIIGKVICKEFRPGVSAIYLSRLIVGLRDALEAGQKIIMPFA